MVRNGGEYVDYSVISLYQCYNLVLPVEKSD